MFAISALGCVSSGDATAPWGRTPATSADAEPVFVRATDQLLVQDDFETYSGITAGDASFAQRYPQYRALDDSDRRLPLDSVVSFVDGRNGGHALRLSYGGDAGASDIV